MFDQAFDRTMGCLALASDFVVGVGRPAGQRLSSKDNLSRASRGLALRYNLQCFWRELKPQQVCRVSKAGIRAGRGS
jgi:hypothetical protein